ncbi:integrin alpha-L-like [Centroberyx affinis]|uniref:integrin alpha-L-like n=1 Tax=Centroberyx affinis TaxID=166261 RepID=UPI003A5C2683
MGEMSELGRKSLLTFMVAVAISVSLAFNIDTAYHSKYAGEENDFFGYKVLQFMSGKNKGVLVTAPLQNGSGEICRFESEESNDCFTPPALSLANTTIPLKHFGLSIAEDSTHSRFTVCSPSVVHECYENSYLNSVCYQFKDQLQPVSTFRPGFQACTKKTVDLAFLFDGSESMTTEEFEKNKDFIVDIMKSLQNSSIKFAAAQFSTIPRKVFDFNDYQEGRALDNLKKEEHMKDLTNTHRALRYMLANIFENQAAGASPDATKVLVIITDGDPSDPDSRTDSIIKKYDSKNIIRFVIGVKNVKLDKLRLIASEPKDNNTFKIEDYNGLTGILENFEKKIFKIEGSTMALAANLTNEMSQSGFSAVYHKDTLVLGSVGSNNWRGSLYEHHAPPSAGLQIQDPNMEEDSYMGYSLSAGEKNNTPLYFTGAPRFQHTGQVVLFTQVSNNWIAVQRVNGEQIGSYFGAELCTVDVDSDSNTDFLLVGAPLFHQSQEKREGQISVYALTHELELKSVMTLSVASRGRFGTAISSLADLNGDGLRDVAVGAPLEDNNRGAVYIYLGDKHRGIRSTFSQRIMGGEILPGLQFFGQAVDGKIDLDDDGLTDIVVGSQGVALSLRSKPVFNVSAHLRFEPAEISTDKIDCLENTATVLPMVILTACFDMAETTQRKAGAPNTGLNIAYTLTVDPMRKTGFRGFLNESDKGAKNLQSTVELKSKQTCFNHSVSMPKCVQDTLSPISIKLNFSQPESETAILNVDSDRQTVVEVPFEKNCRKNDTCIAELEVDFNFITSTLLVVDQAYFNVTVSLSNHGDDSYNTSLTLHYPPGLSFSMMTLMKASRSTLHTCNDLEGVMDKTICSVSLPVYRSRSTATFKTLFRIMNTYDWNDTMSMTITGQSDNENSTRGSMTKSVPVQFQIDLAVKLNEDSITYLTFTPEDSAPKRLVTIYEVKNLGFKALPVVVTLNIPTKLKHNFEMKNYQVSVQQNKTQCRDTVDVKSAYCSDENDCKSIMCESFILEKYSTILFMLSGEVEFKDLKQHAKNVAFLKRYTGDGAEVLFKSFIQVRYDKQRYVQASSKKENKDSTSFPQVQTDVRVEFIISPDQMLIIATGVGGGLLLLIIITVIMFKMGCFKRKTVQYYQDQEDQADGKSDPPTAAKTDGKPDPPTAAKTDGKPDPPTAAKTDGKPDPPAEAKTDGKSDPPAETKPLLDGGDDASDRITPGNAAEGSDKTQSASAQTADHYAKVI